MSDICAVLGLPAEGASPRVSKTAGRKDLCALFAALGFTAGAEIGVWQGFFAQHLCLTVPGLQLTCVDPWRFYPEYKDGKNNAERLEQAYETTRARLAPFHCRILRMTSVEAVQRIPDRSLDFVYIDANHRKPYVLADLEAWTPKVRSGGIVSGHDYTADARKAHIQVKAAVDAFTAARGIGPLYVLAADKSPSFFWIVT